MAPNARLRILSVAFASAAMITAAARPVHGQAFTPAQGEGAVSILFQDQFFKYHVIPTTETDAGQIYTKTLLFDVTYGLTDKVAVSVALPWVATRYSGTAPHPLADFS